MKTLKRIGIITIVIALFCGLGIVGRVETEDRQYRNGEIIAEELTSDSDLIKQIVVCGCVDICVFAIGQMKK